MTFTIPGSNLQASRQHFPFSTPPSEPIQFVRSQKTGEIYIMPDSPKPNQAMVAVPVKVAYPVTNPATREFKTIDGDTLSFLTQQAI